MLKILHRQFHLIWTVLVRKKDTKNEWKWRNLHHWQKFYTATGSDGMENSTSEYKTWPLLRQVNLLRDRWRHQNGWNFGKVPNGLTSPPLFSENHAKNPCQKVQNLQHKFLDWKWPHPPLLEHFRKFICFGGVTRPLFWNLFINWFFILTFLLERSDGLRLPSTHHS